MMKILKFAELPISTWDGYNHVPYMRLINMDEVSQIVPNGKWKQTKILFKNGTEEIVNEYYDDVIEMIEDD